MAEISGTGEAPSVGFAGDTFNTAVYCQRMLGRLGTVSYHTRLGSDLLSEGCRRFAARHDVALSGGRGPDRNIGVYAVQTDEAGARSFAYWRSASAARGLFLDEGDFRALEAADIFYF